MVFDQIHSNGSTNSKDPETIICFYEPSFLFDQNDTSLDLIGKEFNWKLLGLRDLMAQRLACRAEDREVPGSSPTQD